MRYLDRFYLVFDDLKTVAPAQVAESASRLGLTFPDGYAEYMSELGEGVLSNYLRVWTPKRIEKELGEHRRRLAENFFWDESGPLSPARARETVMLGDAMNGDNLVFHPDRPDELFVLPRHDDQIYRAGLGLEAAIDWILNSGVVTQKSPLRYFEPFGKRDRVEVQVPHPYQVVRDALVGLNLHDHVAFEERSEDEEKVFDVKMKVGDKYVDLDDEEAMIELLVKEFGGDVTVETGGLSEPDSTDVTITYVAGQGEAKLAAYLERLEAIKGWKKPGLFQKLLRKLEGRRNSQ